MFQIIFNEISAAEMAAIPKLTQLDLLAEFQLLPENLDKLDKTRFTTVKRDGKTFYRYRATDYRIYFGKCPEGILIHRVLHKNTIRDFLFRSKLPMNEDEAGVETTVPWELIKEGQRARKS